MKVVAITPTRRGSKGIVNKNLRMLCGKPLVWYTINAVKQSSYEIRHIVSTDDLTLMTFTEQHVETRLHPDELSADKRSAFGVVRHVVASLQKEDYTPDIVLLLRATSPLRTSQDIDNAIDLFLVQRERGIDSVVGYAELESPHPKRMRAFDQGRLLNIFGEKEHALRQDLEPRLLVRTEAIYVTLPELILQGTLWGSTPYPYIMAPERSININHEIDFVLAEALLSREQALLASLNWKGWVHDKMRI